MNLLEASNSNEWNHQIIEKPEHVMDSNELNHDHEGINELWAFILMYSGFILLLYKISKKSNILWRS